MIPDMTLIDYFAGQALTGLLSQTTYTETGYPCPNWEGDSEDVKGLCQRAYRIAETMLEAKKIIAADKKEKS